MNSISLHNVLPEVFVHRPDNSSDLWLQDVTFERGHLYLIEAASGTGKSSLCAYLTGYRRDYRGTISFDGRDIRKIHTYEWTGVRRRSLSLMFQELRLFSELTAWENVQIKNQLTRHKTDAELAAWFEALGIAEKRDVRIGQMSFGQQQRVALIRSLCQSFDFLLADEPVSHLDQDNSQAMGEVLMQEARRQGAGVIVTSIGHHIDLPYERVFRL
ncbi:MAG: ATP-binding cassette domain-containing protein [Bacteroidaceae bacterium]|nr:ATP-binding cassette domain-containing protein [Bacteroidaceae bacterium]